MRHPGTGRLLQSARLPFGYLDSPRLFCSVTEAIASELRKRAAWGECRVTYTRRDMRVTVARIEIGSRRPSLSLKRRRRRAEKHAAALLGPPAEGVGSRPQRRAHAGAKSPGACQSHSCRAATLPRASRPHRRRPQRILVLEPK